MDEFDGGNTPSHRNSTGNINHIDRGLCVAILSESLLPPLYLARSKPLDTPVVLRRDMERDRRVPNHVGERLVTRGIAFLAIDDTDPAITYVGQWKTIRLEHSFNS